MPSGIYERTERTRKRMSEAHKGGHYLKISEAMKGIPFSEEHKKHISEAHWKGGKKMADARKTAKRKSFNFIPLNKSFEGANAHHIDKTYVIYIPEEVHRSIPHSVLRNQNMDEINAIAFNYL